MREGEPGSDAGKVRKGEGFFLRWGGGEKRVTLGLAAKERLFGEAGDEVGKQGAAGGGGF